MPKCLNSHLPLGDTVLVYDVIQQLDERRVQAVAAEDLIEYRVDDAVAELDEGIHLTGGAGLAGQEFLELFAPGRIIEPKSVFKLPEDQVDVHGLKMVGNNLRNHNEKLIY